MNRELFYTPAESQQIIERINHDFKAEVRKIRSFIEIIRNEYQGKLDKDLDSYISFIEKSCISIDSCIQLGNYFYNSLNIKVNKTELSLNQVIRDLIENSLVGLIKKRNATIEIKNDLGKLFGDYILIKKAFYSIISNGLIFNKSDSPKITVQRYEDSNQIKISFLDNGIGFPDDFQIPIPLFYKRNHDLNPEGQGTSLCFTQKIMKMHRGNLKIYKKNDEGSSVTLYFKN